MLKGNLPEVFLDTDVAFDIISKREPFFNDAIKILEFKMNDRIALLISESSITNLIYLSFEIYKLPDALERLKDFILCCEVVHSNKNRIIQALDSSFKDKEDALQYQTAVENGADYLITRNIKDFRSGNQSITVLTPLDFLNSIP